MAKEASQATPNCQVSVNTVQLRLPISRRMVATAATHGVYSAQNARNASAAAVATIRREMGSLSWTALTLVWQLGVAWLASFADYQSAGIFM